VIVLLRKICNAIIQQARAVLNGEKIFAILDGSRPQEASVMIRGAVHVMGQFKVAYLEYKAKVGTTCCIASIIYLPASAASAHRLVASLSFIFRLHASALPIPGNFDSMRYLTD
jgi:hypothetical protein